MPSPSTIEPAPRAAASATTKRRLALAYAGSDDVLAELRQEPVTIGAGPKCSVRLDGAGLRPLHCVVTPTPTGPLARRWADGTRLNGNEFTEAILALGDLLRVGQADLRVIELVRPTDTESTPQAVVPVAAPALPAELPSEAPAARPTPALETPAEWVDDSFEQIEQSRAAGPAPLLDAQFDPEDPAIPGRLLAPWARAGEAPTPAPRDTASSIVLLNPNGPTAAPDFFDSLSADGGDFAPFDAFAAGPAAAFESPLDAPPAVETPPSGVLAIESLELNTAAADRWTREFEASEAPHQSPTGDASPEPDAPAPADTRVEARLRARAIANRHRAGSLAAALRTERESLARAADAIAQRDAVLAELTRAIAAEPTATAESVADVVAESVADAETPPGACALAAEWSQPADEPAAQEASTGFPVWGEHEHADRGSDPGCDEAPAEQVPANESPWGIERLAQHDAAPIPSPWGEPTDEAASPHGPADATVDDAAVPSAEAEHVGSIDSAVFAEAAPSPPPLAAFLPKESEPKAETAEPESFIAKYAALLPADDEPVAPIQPVDPSDHAAEPAAVDSAEEDDSIDDYMRRLLERARGGDPVPAAASPIAVAAVAAVPEAETPEVIEAPIRDLSEIKRVAAAVVPAADLGAMRQLANQSARQAIDVAATKQNRERATLSITGGAIALGCGLLAALTASSPLDVQFGGGVLAAVAGGWFGYRTLRATQSPFAGVETYPADSGELAGAAE